MDISTELVKDLRQRTGAGIMDCKTALRESKGDIEAAIDYLRRKGLAAAAKRAGRLATRVWFPPTSTPEGRSVFSSRSTARPILLPEPKIFSSSSRTSRCTSLPPTRNISPGKKFRPRSWKENGRFTGPRPGRGKPEKVIDKIVDGKLERFFSEVCLLEQTYIKDSEQTVKEVLDALVAKIGENIAIRRFARFQLGEGLAPRPSAS